MSKAFKIVGIKNVVKNMEKAAKTVDARTAKALTDEANEILKEAMIECPVETGTLRRSGTVGKITNSKGSVGVDIGFHTNYAVWVHERTTVAHKQGKAKFLEDPVNAAVPGFAQRVAMRMRTGGLI